MTKRKLRSILRHDKAQSILPYIVIRGSLKKVTMKQQEIFKQKRENTKPLLSASLQQDFTFTRKAFLGLSLGLLLITASSFEVIDEVAETEKNKTDTSVECKTEISTQLQEEEGIVNTFLDYIPGLREYLFRFKRTDLKKTC